MQDIAFQEGDIKSFSTLLQKYMQEPIKHFEKELTAIRTGRANTALVENILVESYDQKIPLKQLATLAAPEARLITIQPWDKSTINHIEKAILTSNVGIPPVNDGTIIRLQLPHMTSSRREELIKTLGKKTENCRVAVRNVRKDFHNEIKDAIKKKIISEDFGKKLHEVLQELTDEFIDTADSIHNKKSQELRAI